MKAPQPGDNVPSPKDIHYTAKISAPPTIKEAVDYWTKEADKALRFELAEEIQAGEYADKPMRWKALVHLKALDMLDAHSEMKDSILVGVIGVIEDEALYHYAGCESAEQFFNELGAQKGGSQRSDMLNIARVIAWVKTHNVTLYEPASNKADEWVEADPDEFFVRKNRDGTSRRARLRQAIPELRRVTGLDQKNSYEPEIRTDVESQGFQQESEIEREVLKQQKNYVSNILREAANHQTSWREYKEALNDIRGAKPVISIYKNGTGEWHVEPFTLDDRQKDRFFRQNQYSAIIKIREVEFDNEPEW